MKQFKDIKIFEKKLNKSLCWNDYIKIGGKLFKIFEYGDLSQSENYVYFYNKRRKMMIYIKYVCPSYKWENGEKIQSKEYKFNSLEVLENPTLWREDTL